MLEINKDDETLKIAFSGNVIDICVELTEVIREIWGGVDGLNKYLFESYVRELLAGLAFAKDDGDIADAVKNAVEKVVGRNEAKHKQD